MKYSIIFIALISGSALHGMNQRASQPILSKKRKATTVVVVQNYRNVSHLPDVMLHYILGFLSSGIHTWGMWDTSKSEFFVVNKNKNPIPWCNFPYQQAVLDWCNFSLVSVKFRKNAHTWALHHFGVTQADYKLFGQTQRIRNLTAHIVKKACERGEISDFDHAALQAKRPYDSELTKKGLVFKELSTNAWPGLYPIMVLHLPELHTPWGTLPLFSAIQPDIHGIERMLSQQLKAAYDLEKIEHGERCQPEERGAYPRAATRIIWNILAARYARESQICGSSQTHQKTFAHLPDVMQHYILDFLSSGIHTCSMYDKSALSHAVAVSDWCNFSSVSKRFRKNAHAWAQHHFGVTESDYKLFGQVQNIHHIADNIVRTAHETGKILFLGQEKGEPRLTLCKEACCQLTKKGVFLKPIKDVYFFEPKFPPLYTQPILHTPWVNLLLLPSIPSHIKPEMVNMIFQPIQTAYDNEDIEKGEQYQRGERNSRTHAATRIIWNILAARYVEEDRRANLIIH